MPTVRVGGLAFSEVPSDFWQLEKNNTEKSIRTIRAFLYMGSSSINQHTLPWQNMLIQCMNKIQYSFMYEKVLRVVPYAA
jgi:hypothetical protein